jgi:hypothetical protein
MIEFSTAFYIAFGFSLLTGVLGYYVGERGWTGVQNDLNNVKLDIANLKGSLPFHGTTTPATVAVVPAIALPSPQPVVPVTTPA